MDFAMARRKMVDNQVRPNEVTDLRLVAAMLEIPRERFVPADKAAMAYMDGNLALDEGGRFLLEPMVVGRLIQAADVKDTDHVLDVACGTGYSSAILARLARSVVALEEDPNLSDRAARLLKEMGVDNAKVVSGSFSAGWSVEAPYDLILINGAVEYVPESLLAQVKDGGRLVTIVGGAPVGKATLYRNASGDISSRPIFDATAPVLPGFVKPKSFIF
jgi:protein-L-isoaspartate(D-aspartate) O-methyltransferase